MHSRGATNSKGWMHVRNTLGTQTKAHAHEASACGVRLLFFAVY